MQSSNRSTGNSEHTGEAPTESPTARADRIAPRQFTIRRALLGTLLVGVASKIVSMVESHGQSEFSGALNQWLLPSDVQRSPELSPIDFGNVELTPEVQCSAITTFQDCGMDRRGAHYIPITVFSVSLSGEAEAPHVLVTCSVRQGKPPNQGTIELTSHVTCLSASDPDAESALLNRLRETVEIGADGGSEHDHLARLFATVSPSVIRQISEKPPAERQAILRALLAHAVKYPSAT